MFKITFLYSDALSNFEWRKQSCIVSSVEECKKLYGLGIDCNFKILSIKKVKE